MSLANLLLGTQPNSGKKRVIDTELDSIFHSQTTTVRPQSISNDYPAAERKNKKHKSDVHTRESDGNRPKPPLGNVALLPASPPEKEKKRRARIASESQSDHLISDAEESESSSSPSTSGSDAESSDESDEDGEPSSTLIHETLQRDKTSKPACRKGKYVPLDETKEQRDARTIFIGNLAPDIAVKRPLQKRLHQHILALVPTAKIESTRFRSMAFSAPTTSKSAETGNEAKKRKELRQHERDRASSWRVTNSSTEPKTDEKKFLTANQKKKIAFINKDIHSDADSVHAYIVFAYPPPHSRPANLPPLPPVLDPFEATRRAIETCGGTMFLDRMLRVDAVTKWPTLGSPSDSTLLRSVNGDPKLSIFVGNLDFASKEDDLRVFFEGVVSAERGPPDAEGSQDGDKPRCWVTRVRMIRDKGTQLGKGFAYVQFSDRTCVDEVLALEPGKLKFAKRKLRVQRCKANPKALSGKNVRMDEPKVTRERNRAPVPKGDPSLGEKLVKLTKEERKRVKAADADRVARRMAKKKARMALVKEGVAPQGKQRQRVRKTDVTKKLGGTVQKKANKGRVRSEKSMTKKNTKK